MNQIVSNVWTGIDMDKFDYFARDVHHLGLKCTVDHRRYILKARAVPFDADDGRLHICVPDKVRCRV